MQGLSQDFGDQASVYAAAMKEQAIDGEALLDLSAANDPIADNNLKELGLTKMGPRRKLQRRIEELRTQNLPRTLSTAPGGAVPRSLAFRNAADRCTAPSAHPPQVVLRGWEYDRLLLSLLFPHPRSDARSFPPSLSISLCVRVCVCVRVRACVCVRACACC